MYSTRVWQLLGRKMTGDATLEELQELEQCLLENPELASSVEVHLAYFENQPPSVSTEEERLAWKTQLRRLANEFPNDFASELEIFNTARNKSRRTLFVWVGAVAAVIISVILFSQKVWKGEYSGWRVEVSKNHSVIETEERKKLVLPDGSTVWLNKGSDLSYDVDFGVTNRNIKLSGEAFFDVVHLRNLPMTIHTGIVNINVKGTAFNVSAYSQDNKVETSLIRGSIELVIRDKPSHKILLKPNEKIVVSYDSKNDSVLVKKPEEVKVKIDKLAAEQHTGLIPEIAWIENKLVFQNESLESVVEKMIRWFDEEIVIKDNALAREKFTGVFESETLEQALDALKMTYDFKYKKNKNGGYVITKN